MGCEDQSLKPRPQTPNLQSGVAYANIGKKGLALADTDAAISSDVVFKLDTIWPTRITTQRFYYYQIVQQFRCQFVRIVFNSMKSGVAYANIGKEGLALADTDAALALQRLAV